MGAVFFVPPLLGITVIVAYVLKLKYLYTFKIFYYAENYA